MNKYKVLLADPPWAYNRNTGRGSARNHYPDMTVEQLCDMRPQINEWADRNCALFLWATFPTWHTHAMVVMEAWGFCTGVGTRTLTDDLRWVPAEELKVGDTLLAFDENIIGDRRYYRQAMVLSTGVEKMPSYRIIMETGEEIVASADHPWLATAINKSGNPRIHRWVRTKEILAKVGRYNCDIAFPRIAPFCLPDKSYESGFLSGAFDSEGSLSMSKGGIRFSQNNNSLMDTVKRFLRWRGYSYSEYDRSETDQCNQIYINGGLRVLMRFMMECRPPRLIDKWKDNNLVASLYNLGKIKVETVEYLGERECVSLMTDTGTYISEGFGSHNTYKTVPFVWVKLSAKTGKPVIGPGQYTRANAEPCLIGIRGKPFRKDKGVPQIILAPRAKHSVKPAVQYRRIQRLYDGPYLELFARREVKGWDVWGDEITGPSNAHQETDQASRTGDSCDHGVGTEV